MNSKRTLEKPKHSPRRVALAFPVRLAHLHTVVQGIADYAHQHGNWIFTTSGEANDLSVRSLRRWQGDGVITSFGTEIEAKAARRLKIPVVTFTALVRNPGIPRVMMDQAAIGRLAAEHLLSRGFRHFGFYGVEGADYSIARESEYSARLAEKNFPRCDTARPICSCTSNSGMMRSTDYANGSRNSPRRLVSSP